MRSKLSAAAGVIALAAAVAVPASPAQADSFRNDQWYLKTLKIAQAHAITKGAGIIVAVVDTGTYPHPDLKKNLITGIDETTGNGNGQTDEEGHGTEIAAIIAAHGKNKSDGVLGIAPDAKILPVKAANNQGVLDSTAIVDGVKWAVRNKASVINLSLNSGPDPDLEQAVTDAQTANIVVVAGAGNTNKALLLAYPAAYDGVLAVGATGKDGKHASYSVTSPKVQICAPGSQITTAFPKDKYVDGSGTSEATAVVSGAAALVRAKFPDLSAKEVIHRLTATADDIGPPGRDDQCGYGELNIIKALTENVAPLDNDPISTQATTTPTTTDETSPAPTATAPTTSLQTGNTKSTSSNTLIIFGGVLAGLAIVGGLVFMTQRRKRSF